MEGLCQRQRLARISKHAEQTSSDSYYLVSQSASSLGWLRFSYAHEPGTTAVVDELGSVFSAGRLPTDDVG